MRLIRFLVLMMMVWAVGFMGFFVTWMLVVFGHCIFTPGCYEHITFNQIVNAVDAEMIAIRLSFFIGVVIVLTLIYSSRQK